ncbi:phenylalanine--tRNA ligase subunit beta [Saccharomycopsis crataegensis]|uniref:Phenylalanine--tRNA ligase beta subunit n=1 Tax=Saccharomycopsis crataegensis TaxID=43959 RepID=A0AAV5QHX1_9ASCO|nr:phenylalanine--tRNA ligase subunit beta [Saccharomycopsis crataegensis]
MPTIAVDKQDLFDLLGRSYTTEEFDELCFEFGIELDEDTTEDCQPGERPELKIEIGANRYDMLCIEGIAQSLNEFLGNAKTPVYKTLEPKYTLTIKESTSEVRPYAAGAILRNVSFNQRSYNSFIALQDKLHTNLCRHRTLVAMGTHDLDKMAPPFTYDARDPKSFSFTPLNQTKKMTGLEQMDFYEKDKNLGKYLHIIKDKPVFPLILDSNDNVGSMPPIINSDLTKISLDTKNVFIDVTGTDRTKVEIVVNTLVCMFSRYCDKPFEIEPIKVISEHNGESRITPNLESKKFVVKQEYINSCLGLELSVEEISKLLSKMSLHVVDHSEGNLTVLVPPTRTDILHACDVMEDAAIAYGYNNLTKTKVQSSALVAKPLPINKVSDILRLASSQSGWLEVMPLTLCSHDENFKFLNKVDNNDIVVKLENPKTAEYQVVRTSLLPGLLKTVRENQKHSLPIKVFEAGDIVLKDDKLERKAFNQKNWAAIYAGKASGFEFIQGLLAKIMQTFRTPWIEDGAQLKAPLKRGYWIEENAVSKTYFPGRGADIFFRAKDGEKAVKIGEIGVLHPSVCNSFEIPYAASSVEINAEFFL